MILGEDLFYRENSGPWEGVEEADAAQLSVYLQEPPCTYIAQIPQPR